MCGFLGCFEGDFDKAKAMTSLAHRGPDSRDEYSAGALYLKHYRLAIIGTQEAAHQPMMSRDGNVILAFNGEIYNYREIATWMGQPQLADDGDTRVLVEFLAQHGIARLDMLNGMFAIAVYFRTTRDFYLIRDRFGVKPLYYCEVDNGLYFASEIKSLRGLSPTSLNSERARNYLDYGIYPGGKYTFFEGIHQVEAGTWLQRRDDTQNEHRYYDLRAECGQLLEEKPDVDEYESLLEDAIRLRLRSDVPISMHYSGGTDSTALLLKTKEVLGWDFPIAAFSMAFDDPAFDESRLAESYCAQIGVQHHKVTLSAAEVPALAAQLHYFEDEPYGGIPTIAYYKLNMAERKKGYIVSIEGQGGDETFGGYVYHAYMAMYDLVQSGANPSLLKTLLQTYRVELSQVVPAAERLIAAGFQAHTDLTDLRESATLRRPEMFIDWLKTIQLYDTLSNKIPRTLRFNDRAAMACGREIRFPLLDYRVLGCGLALSHEQKYAHGLNKAPLRKIIRRHLHGVYAEPKRSVVTPQTQWLQCELKVWAQERIDVLRQSAFLPTEYFDRVDAFYRSKNPTNSFYIWQLINLSFFFDQPRIDE